MEAERRRKARDREELERDAGAIRARCKSLYAFVQEFWSVLEPETPFLGGWALKAMCDHLEAVTRGDIQYLLITVPPGMMKSLLVAVFWPAWEWGPAGRPTLRYLTTSFSRPNVIRDNTKMRKLVESEKYQRLWGDKVRPTAKWGEEKFENSATGNREGRAFDSMTGGRGDRVIIDDPHSVKMGESDVQRARVITTFREAIPDRLNDLKRSAIVVIMQRLHAGDVAGTILKLGLPYVHLNLPMEYEPEQHCSAHIGGRLFFTDPRTRPGELLFPERFPRAEVEALKRVKGSYAWAGQYQQRPTAREGGLFKRHWFEGKIISRDRLPAHVRRRVRSWDFAASEATPGTSPDWTVGVRMSRDGPDFYIEHVVRLQATAGVVQRTVKATADVDPTGTVVRIPQDPSQAGKGQVQSYVKALAGYAIRAVLTSGRGDKVARAEPMAIQAEFGHIYLVEAAWNEEFLDEITAFPTGANDDQVDAASDGFDELADGSDKPFESESAGTREVVAHAGRDSRYQFGDRDGDEDEPVGDYHSARGMTNGIHF
jgi:predicted phage terminase large subunit-like protein